MKILAIDTATENCSAAILYDDEILALSEEAPREHTQRILPMVDQLLADAGLTLNQFDALAYGQGPGSFTGVRIGIGIAQGLAFGAQLPMIGVSTLAAMAQGAIEQDGAERVYAAIDARMEEIYWGAYHKNDHGLAELRGSEQVIHPTLLNDTHLMPHHPSLKTAAVGTGWVEYGDILKPLFADITMTVKKSFSDARYMLPLAKQLFEQGVCVAAEKAEPVYLRDTVTWKKLPGR